MRKGNTRSDKEIIAILEKTPLVELITVLRTGKLQPSPDELVGKKEVVIGELTDEERALHSALSILDKKAEEIANNNNRMVESANSNHQPVDDLRVFLNRAEFEAAMGILVGLREVMWCSVKKRIGAPANERSSIGIRNGYQIVSFDRELDDCSAEAFAKSLARGLAMGCLN